MANEVTFTGQSGATWRYWTDQPLGTPGGFGGVYAAEGSDGTPMAVKVVNKQRPSGVLDDRLLRREIDIGKRVVDTGSEMLLPVIDAADANDALLLVMTRAEGALAAASVPMVEAEVVPVLVDIATGLQDLHSIGIIHRDLKPANVLRHAGRWKLADFGIARDQEIGTQDPTFVGWGSFPYMAPELWELKSPTVKTDLYALGCLAFELLAGAPPYTGDQAALRAGHLTQAPPEVPCSNVVLKNLITRLIAKDPADRPQDARAVLDRLRRALVPAAQFRNLSRADSESTMPSRPAPLPSVWQPRPPPMYAVSRSRKPRQTCARSSTTHSMICGSLNQMLRSKSAALTGQVSLRRPVSVCPLAALFSGLTCGKE